MLPFSQTTTPSWTAFQGTLVTVVLVLLATTILLYFTVVGSKSERDVHQQGFAIQTSWSFFNQRFDFVKSSFMKSGREIISFKLFHHSVVAMRGQAARKAFLDNKSLDPIDGYELLLGGTPRLRDLHLSHELHDGLAWFTKQIVSILSKERNAEVLPTLIDDVQMRMESWGRKGRMDPFKCLPDLIFQMTVRMATCRELATDTEVVTKFQRDFSLLEKSANPVTLLLPWLPTTAKRMERTSINNLRATLRTYVEKRKKSTIPNSDTIDFLLSRGLQVDRIIACILNLIWVGLLSLSVNSYWILIFLECHKEWKQKLIGEINSIVEKYASTSSDPLHKRLGTIPLSVWEEEMPIFDLVLRETLRLTVDGTLPRRMHNDLDIMGQRFSKGSFVVYQVADVHMDPDIYTNPTQFDPARFGPRREEDKKEDYAFIGWGAGRHPCTGQKFAKLEIKILVTLFLAAYQYELVNKDGVFPEHRPSPNYNDLHKSRSKEAFYFEYKRVVD